jgi:hypothetical protein
VNTDDRPKIESTLYEPVLEVQALYKRAEALDMFVVNRELLTKNVSFESQLFTYFRPNEMDILSGDGWPEEFVFSADTRLRFEQITPAQFRCPSCDNLVGVPPE